jgi:hypothetical protein
MALMTIDRDEFRNWFLWFGEEAALMIVSLKFMRSEDARIRFAQQLLGPGYKIERMIED